MYLYLTTAGRVTGQPREIEIWFTEHGGHFYLVAERESANWVRNIQSQPQVKARVGDAELNAIAGVVHNGREPQLAATVRALFDAKYGWSDGLIVELTAAYRSPAIGLPTPRIAGTADNTRPKQAFPMGPGKGRNAQNSGHCPTAGPTSQIDINRDAMARRK
jgi:deazaflavin-dependent oxidoreductase (nitroreductase family)